VMLSEWERQALQEIEQQISRETPWFEASMQRLLSDRAHKSARRGHDTIITVAALSAVLCFALSSVGAGVPATLLAAVTFYLRRRRFPPRIGRSPVSTPPVARLRWSSPSFSPMPMRCRLPAPSHQSPALYGDREQSAVGMRRTFHHRTGQSRSTFPSGRVADLQVVRFQPMSVPANVNDVHPRHYG
jgi:hypothetical protein